MAVELPDKKTPVTKAEIITAVWHAWMQYFGSVPPSKEAVWVLVAQWALETGWGASMHNYNMGNVKSRDGDGCDWQYFPCWEVLPVKQAESMAKAAPGLVRIKEIRQDGKAVTWFYPKHPACRFRAFRTLLDGAIDHFHVVTNKYSKAWSKVLEGNPEAYAKALKAQGYYTADESAYAAGLRKRYDAIAAEPFDYDTLPVLTDAETSRLQNLVARTIQMSVDDLLVQSRATLDDDA